MGAKGGVNYRNKDWSQKLREILPANRRYLDAVIDGAGDNVIEKTIRLLKPGGVISQYGMTASPKMSWPISAVLANVELKGSAMGSQREFRDMIDFVDKNKIRPIFSRTVRGLDNLAKISELFTDIEEGMQFGKLVIEIEFNDSAKL